tara:strand:- start:381 stop:695 length:315 start_codon:yes stop_codon:yes gene_type:complete
MKKATRPEEQSRPRKAKNITPLPPRLKRLAMALLNAPAGVPRETCDKIAPASNGPHYIGKLRNRLKLEIPCDRVNCITKDGEASWYGLYRLTHQDRQKLLEVMQ